MLYVPSWCSLGFLAQTWDENEPCMSYSSAQWLMTGASGSYGKRDPFCRTRSVTFTQYLAPTLCAQGGHRQSLSYIKQRE